MKWGVALTMVLAALAGAPAALADDWLPHNPDATWTYQWTDTAYNPSPTNEKVTVKSTAGDLFTLAWTTAAQGNAANAVNSTGTVSFQDTGSGLAVVSPYWSSNGPPPQFPVLCATVTQCPNSLVSTYYNVIWGSLTPVLAEPLLKGTTWTAAGGDASISSTSTYLGPELVTVPAFPQPVLAAKVRTDVTQAGALGDPYGSGVKTVWWVYGVGPVKVVFQHAGGVGAAVTTSVLQSTNLVAKALPSDVNWFPMEKGLTGTYRWTNAKHLKKPEIEKYVIDQVANGSARASFTCVSGQIRCAALYFFTQRTDGLTNLSAVVKAQSLAKFPPLGPAALPAGQRRHFFTPFDLMSFGINPVIGPYAKAGDTWSVDPNGRDFAVFGATATSKVIGVQQIKVPAGTFSALVVRTTLKQAGFPFGSGVRTCWFAPDRGLVKLVFQHGDHSTSVVVLTK
ncbi:MAG TPA: hypothetical protein VNC40_08680 [Gaiellaceae bacterium]|nr:hypothetical protein [Gaiellaceae bacterium]